MGDISQQLVGAVKNAAQTGTALNIVGRGTKRFMGRTPAGQALCLDQHSGIVDYCPVELVITARAGTSLEKIAAALDQHDQMLPFEPPTFGGNASIGGTLACNLSGPARPWSGGIRDSLLGIRLINGKGEHLNFGGRVMKNVAGYDVTKLQAGAMGSLGIVTEASLKVIPKPAATLTITQNSGVDQAIETMNRTAAKCGALTGACWLDNKLYLRFSGARSAVAQASTKFAGDVVDRGDDFWNDLREMKLDFFQGADPLWRFSLKSTSDHFLKSGRWLIDWAGAQRWLSPATDSKIVGRAALEQAAVTGCGQAMLFRGGDRNSEVFHTQTDMAMEIHRRLKSAFDPNGLFNRGRLYSWL